MPNERVMFKHADTHANVIGTTLERKRYKDNWASYVQPSI